MVYQANGTDVIAKKSSGSFLFITATAAVAAMTGLGAFKNAFTGAARPP